MCCFVMSKMNLSIDMRHWFEERLTMQQSTGERSMFLRQSRNGISSWGLHIFACFICKSLYSCGSFRTFFIDQYFSLKDSWNLLDPEAACKSSSCLWTCEPHIPPTAGLPGTGQTHLNIQKKCCSGSQLCSLLVNIDNPNPHPSDICFVLCVQF